jgi:DNA-binding NtrC family response regulator
MTAAAPIKVFIAEDEQPLAKLLADHLSSCGHVVSVVHDGRSALDRLSEETYDVALLDIVMPEMTGLDVLRHVRWQANAPEIIMITGNGTMETALTAIRLGAYDFLAKPYRLAEVEVIVRRASERRMLARANAALQTRLSHVDPVSELITEDPRMLDAMTMVEKVAPSDAPVLVAGESGTGKELVARILHRRSAVSEGPFVDINCAAIGGMHVEYELFGYESGTLPGSTESRAGTLELASGGSLFMDEVSALDQRLQAVMSRVIEERRFSRAGGTQKVVLDARLIAATNRDLSVMVSEGAFRDDLYFRINGITITLPPLRERPTDVLLLTQHFLERFGGANPPVLEEDAREALARYTWPGNVRELRNVVERAVLLAREGRIHASDLPFVVDASRRGSSHAELTSLTEVERDHIHRVLRAVQWHQGRAATILGISSKTLYRKIREYGFKKTA